MLATACPAIETVKPITIINDYCLFIQNDSYATLSPIESSITPLHGVSTPQHDFSEFNIKRRSTLISVSITTLTL